MMPPIPRTMLTRAMLVNEPENGEYGGEVQKVTKLLDGVRFEPHARHESASYSATQYGGVVYVDAVNTSNAYRVPVGSLVRIGGFERQYRVAEVFEYEDAGRIHHWELQVL